MTLNLKKSILAVILLLIWQVIILKMNWFNDTAGRYQYFLNLIIIVVFQLVAFRDYNSKNTSASNKDRILFIIPFNLLVTILFVLGTVLLFQVAFPEEIAKAIQEKSLLLEQSRSSMVGKSLAQQNELIKNEIVYAKMSYRLEGILIFKGALTFFHSMLLGSILAFTMNGKKLFD